MFSKNTNLKPDFAYPKTVMANAQKNLEKAINDGNGVATLRYAIDMSIAQSLIDPDSINSIVNHISRIADNEKRSDIKALLHILLADTYTNIYVNDRYTYDRRQIPLTPLSDDCRLWSGDQFKAAITSLCDLALEDADTLKGLPIGKYSSVISLNSLSAKFYPTLYDFVANRVIQNLAQLAPAQLVFSARWLCRYDLYERLQFPYADPTAEKILSIYARLLSFHEGNPAPFVITDISRIEFVASKVSSDNADNMAFSSLHELYQLLGNSEYAGEALLAMEQYDQTTANSTTLYNSIHEYLKRHPHYFRSNALRDIVTRMSQARVEVSAPTAVVPNRAFSLDVNIRNANHYSLAIYSVPYDWQNYSFINRVSSSAVTLIDTIRRNVAGIIPFAADDKVDITLPKMGCYIIVPILDGEKPDFSNGFSFIHCSEISLASTIFANDIWALAINPLTGAPVANASLQTLSDREIFSTHITDKEGIALISKIQKGRYIPELFAKKGADRFAAPIRLYNYNYRSSTTYDINLFTDLALYRLGDTMSYSGVAYSTTGDSHSLLVHKEVTISLRDANYQVKDTAIVTTDDWGRFDGSFTLPSDGLTGRFILEAKLSDENRSSGQTHFMVSDYKLPTFQVEVTDICRNQPDTADVTIRGKAISYSGFPLAGINVAVDLAVTPRYWWRGGQSYPYQSLSATTEADGSFSVALPAAMLAEAPIANSIFIAKITVTSSIGESQSVSTRFTQGPSSIIESTISSNSDLDVSRPISLGVRLVDVMGKPVDGTVDYSLMQADTIVSSGSLTSSEVDWSSIPAGSYTLKLSAHDADTLTISNLGLYRPTDAMPPKTDPIWLPVSDYILRDSNRMSILYGTSADTTHIRYAVWTPEAILSQGWIAVPAGMHHFDYTLPDSIDKANVSLMATHKFKSSEHTITVRAERSIKEITIVAESFRDHITPGTDETWTFRVKDHSGSGVHAAMMFDMYSKALDAITPQRWNFDITTHQLNHLNFNAPALSGRYSESVAGKYKLIGGGNDIEQPEFETWGYSIGESHRVMAFGARVLYAAAESNVYDALSEDEEAVKESTVKAKATGAAAPDDEPEQQPFAYRDAETPLAFFRPMLTTAEDGSLEFSFTTPNANTTWQLCALAFTRDLQSTTFSHQVLANKPIMVQPNLPRFLRTGDSAVIAASVMNLSDSTQIVSTIVEIFEPATNRIISRQLHTDEIEAGSSATAKIRVVAPMSNNMIGYRIKASTATFADGEQSIIPILEAFTPVINTKPFYIGADEHSFSMEIPEEIPQDATVTLEFCENPVWYCVTALPGLRSEKISTSMEASAAIFSAAVAEGIIRNNPTIARALLEWQSSDKSDSTLVSMLERNPDLKTVLLNSTPWVMDAKSDTERMARLSLLFDKKEIEKTYSAAIQRLAELQCNGGGWAWIAEQDQASQWVTYNILSSMGRLRQLGYLPDNKQLDQMIVNAVKYIDAEAVKEFKKYPNSDYTDYVITRDFYPTIKQSTAALRVSTAIVQRLVGDWKERDLHGKAVAALILNNHDYHATSLQILESLNEFSQYTPQRGMWWPSLDNAHYTAKIGTTSLLLDAYNTITPKAAEVDRIRQWLILQKQATNWGTALITSDVIASILTSGSNWTRPSVGAVVKIGGEEVKADRIDRMLGYFRTSIGEINPAGKVLTVAKAADYPSWGTVYCQYFDQMNNVAQQECDEVSIEKQFYVKRGSEWEPADSMKVGDLVKVELIIRANKDMDYVAIIDDRAACFEPTEQRPKPIYCEGVYFYRENRDASTTMFVESLHKGVYRLGYELYVNNAGTYTGGIASLQSQYAPAMAAHSAGATIEVK